MVVDRDRGEETGTTEVAMETAQLVVKEGIMYDAGCLAGTWQGLRRLPGTHTMGEDAGILGMLYVLSGNADKFHEYDFLA